MIDFFLNCLQRGIFVFTSFFAFSLFFLVAANKAETLGNLENDGPLLVQTMPFAGCNSTPCKKKLTPSPPSDATKSGQGFEGEHAPHTQYAFANSNA